VTDSLPLPLPTPPQTSGPVPPKPGGARRPPGKGVPVWLQAFLIVGLGCGTFLALLLLMIVGAAWWVLRPGAQVPTDAIVGPDSIGVVRIEALAEDGGVRGAIERFSREVADIQEERTARSTPEWLRRMQGERRGPPTFLMTMMFPRDATLLFERVPGDEQLHLVFAGNFRWLVRPARLLLGLARSDHELHSEGYAGYRILSDPDGGLCLCFAGSTFLAADDMDVLKIAIDRLDAFRADAPPPLPPGIPQAQEGWDVAGVLEGRPGDLQQALAFLPVRRRQRSGLDRLVSEGFDRATVAIDWETTDRIRARFTVDAIDDLTVEAWVDELELSLAELVESMHLEGLTLTPELDLYDGRVTVDLTLDGVERLIERAARNL